MRVCKKSERQRSLFVVLLLWGGLNLPIATSAKPEQGIVINQVSGGVYDGMYTIHADMNYHLGPEIEKALKHGVPLQFITRIVVRQQRRWLWDKTIMATTLTRRVQYHPLSEDYLVVNMADGASHQFNTLTEVMAFLGKLKNYPLLPRHAMAKDTRDYYGRLQVTLDLQSLPAPLRPQAYVSSQWRLASPVFAWKIHL